MSLRNNKFYIASFLVCFISAVIVKQCRENYAGDVGLIVVLMGSLPSFLALFGFIALVPLVHKNITFPAFIKTTIFIVIGSLAYEIEQVFSSRTFDYNDVFAIIMAWLLMLGLHRIEKAQT
jgi:hypothetical protein